MSEILSPLMIILISENVYYMEIGKSAYTSGEIVNILYRITNKTGDIINMGEAADCEYCKADIYVTQNDTEIWKFCPTIPPCGFTEFILYPGESWEYEYQWDIETPVSDSIYTITAELRPADEDIEKVPVSVSVEIRNHE